MTKKNGNYILLVDDNEDDVELTRRALKQCCLTDRVVITRDGQEALDYIFIEGEYKGMNHLLPIVVLLDLNMPRVGGLDVIKRLRANEHTKFLPVVVFTTSDEQCDVMNSYELGANSFVRKPVNIEQFYKAIQDFHVYWTVQNVAPHNTSQL